MSHLPAQAVDEFQALWKKHCGAELPREQATVRANEVFAVLRLLLEQPHRNHHPQGRPLQTSSQSSLPEEIVEPVAPPASPVAQ